MAASRKFDISASPDRSPYTSGSRVMYGGTSLDRCSSFRESMENPILSRSSVRATQGNIHRFFQSLHFDPKVVGPENKFQRLLELKKALNFIVATSQDNSASGSVRGRLLSLSSHEDLKNAKASLQESSKEARERFKIFSEALFVFKKLFPSIPLRKRSRTEVISGDRANTVPLNGRSGGDSRVVNIGSPGHTLTNAPEVEIQKSEERTKNTKRPRTSVQDVRANSLARHVTLLDRDRDVVRGTHSGAVLANEQRLTIESWERSKMKKKRSGVMADISPSTSSAKPDGLQELKQGMRQRLANESLGFRSRVGNGALGIRQLDGQLQQTEFGVRSSIARLDHEKGSVFGDHKERPSDKDGVNLKTVNKVSMQEDHSSHSPTSNTKLFASARAPRSCASNLPKMSPSSQQLISSDWEISQCLNKPSASGSTNRKRRPSAQSSSPPVANWARQRPHKISRAAKRTNFLPIVANNDETLAFDATSDAGNDTGYMFVKPLPSMSAQEVKLKSERLSESLESGVADTKNGKKKSKNKMTLAKAGDRAGHNVKKAPNPVFPAKKNKLIGVEELGDGDQRQGGISQNLPSSRSLMPMAVKKLRNIGPKKQPRSSKMGLDKAERKTGCPMRKLSNRKAYTHNRLYAVNAEADFCDDGQQELLVAVKATFDPSHSSLFWRHLELVFKFASEADIDFLKQQSEVVSVSDTPNADANGAANCLNGFRFMENLAHTCLSHTSEQWTSEATFHDTVPLCQRLIAALIPDEEEHGNGTIEEMQLDSHETGFHLNAELESDDLTHGSVGNSYPAVSKAPNVCSATVAGGSFYELEALDKLDPKSHMVSIQNFGGISSSGYLFDGLLPGSEMIPVTETAESQYVNMPIGERLLLELQSIGICLEQPEMREMDNEEVGQEIKHLCKEYNQKITKKRHLIHNLLKSASRERQEHNFEQCALEKLMTVTYGKYMASFRGRGVASKMTKQAALAFVNRTLEHCQRYEDTGRSCFDTPLFKDIFSAALNKITETESVDRITENESDRGCSDLPLEEPSSPEQNIRKRDTCSDKMKNGELLDVGGGAIVTSDSPPGTGRLHVSTTKGKRSGRDRNGKGHVSKNGTTKLGRPVGNNIGHRKSKVKAKQKTTQLSASITGLRGKMSEQPKGLVSPLSCEQMTNNNAKKTEELGIDGMDDPIVDVSSLEVPGIDVDLGDQGQDLASWLNIDDDSLQDHDFMGLEIPMDDLFDVNMMV